MKNILYKKLMILLPCAGMLLAVDGALASSTVISNTPMAVQNTAKSNIVFTMDSSGGMDYEVLLPTFNSMYYESGVTPGNNPSTLNGNVFLFPTPYRDNPTLKISNDSMLAGDLGNPDVLGWRARNAHYNPQYYDPFKTYQPWAGADKSGSVFQNAVPTAIQYDPYGHTLGTIDITSAISTGQIYGAWTVPPAHTYLSTATPPTDITLVTPLGGRSYPSAWFIPAYYVWTDANNNGVLDAGEGTRYEIKDSTKTCAPTVSPAVIPGCGGTSNLFPSGRTYASELQNFANWFQYYRTTMLTMQAAVGKQLATLGGARVGMTYLQPNVIPAPVSDMSVPSNLSTLQGQVYQILPNLADWRQPIHERMVNVFNYFSQQSTTNGVPAPIQYACQQNFNILVTPGYLNENSASGASYGFENYFTGVTPTSPFPVGDYDSTGSGVGAQTVPYADWSVLGNPSYPNTLADWSLFIYNQNLRPDLTPGQVPLGASTAHETNANPHLDTYVIAPGAIPVLGESPRYLNPATTDPYSISPSIDWPQPFFVSQSTVDDLWHASVNGRGLFINNTDIYGGLTTVLNDIMGRVGGAAGVAVSNTSVTPGDNFSYASSYNSGDWSGDLQAYAISLSTGQPATVGSWAPSSRDQLDKLVQTSSRYIATYNGTAGIPFRWASLTSANQSLLNTPGAADGSTVLQFLRGDRSLEGTKYRIRGHVLGDIINAEPVIVREPLQYYSDVGYAAYKTQYTTTTPRKKMVYQAANDGILHAFDAGSGAELWGYVPGLLFNSRMTSSPSTSTLAGLSAQTGFNHVYMVDGTPASGDVDLNHTNGLPAGAADWHSILVGGLGKGGRGYYALDTTVPVIATEADVAAKALWEFPNQSTAPTVFANIGYSYAKPIITKTAAAGWVVIVSSGYNNGTNPGDSGGDGHGHLFVLNAKTGALIKDITTPVGSPSIPSGMAQISGWADNRLSDNTVKQVYGTDLLGNVWRFDLSSASTAGWSVTLLATLVDQSGAPQPITTTPALGLVNGKHMIYVGTGQYLSSGDIPPSPALSGLPSTQVQSMYGLIDDLTIPVSGPVISPLRSQLLQQTLVAGAGGTRTVAANQTLSSTQKGWYLDFALLPLGERVTTNPSIANTTLVFTTNTPSSADPCQPGGSSSLYAINYTNGSQVVGSTWAGMSLGNALASRPILVQMPDGTIRALVRGSDNKYQVATIPVAATSFIPHRVSWREIAR